MSASDQFQHPTRRVNELWQTDFTYFRVVGWGWYYLSTVLDDYSRYIIAWKLFQTMAASDVQETLDLALEATRISQVQVRHTDRTITGTVGFLGPGSGTTAAPPVILTLDDGSTGSSFEYSIPPRSVQRFTTSSPSGALNSGSVRATPHSGNAAPSGLVVFSYAPAGKTLSEAGVPALPNGSAFRVYAEAFGTRGQMGSISTGLAIANTADTSNTVTLEVTHLDGSLAVAPATLALPPSDQVARFLDEFFSLPDNFSGVLRVTSTADVAIVALRLRINEKGEIKVTTLAPSNERDPSTSEERFFPHIADSGGWSTQFILFSGTAGQASSGTLTFIDAFGQPLDLPITRAQP